MRNAWGINYRHAGCHLLSTVIAAIMLNSCVMGPDFHRPLPPKIKQYTAQPLPASTISVKTTGGNKQYLVNNLDIPAQWWKLFHSKPLNDLIASALQTNPDLKAAAAALRVAQENAMAQRATLLPYVSANLNPTRHLTAHTLSSIVASNAYVYSLTTPQLTVSYVPDVFGGNMRQVESLQAQAETALFQQEAIYLTLTSNVVMAVIQEASIREQIKATQRSIAIAQKQLDMMLKQQSVGQIGAVAVAAQQAALAQAQTVLPPLQKQLAQQRHLLSVLCGHFPSEEFAQKFELSSLTLPEKLPLGIPARLIEQRPDIRAAEAQIHAASAQIGVAIANQLPNIVITADAGSSAIELGTLFSSLTKFWDIGLNLTQPVFDAGALLHKKRAAIAAYQQAVEQYRSVVLASFQDVADTLKAIQFDAISLKTAANATQAARRSLAIAQQQWEAGAVDHLFVLNAQQNYQQALITLAQNQANRFIDTAALFQALGGGWWNRDVCSPIKA